MFAKLITAAVVAGVAVGAVALDQPAAAGDGAVVFNHEGCQINVPPNFYVGYYTEVLTPSGNWKVNCNAELVAGPGVTENTKGNLNCFFNVGSGPGTFNLTPGGTGHAKCQFKP
jgi:phage gp45-like